MKVQDAIARVRNGLNELQTQLNTVVVEELEEPFKGTYENFRSQINGILSKLPPLEQQAGAQQSNYGLEYLGQCLLSAQHVIKGMFDSFEVLRAARYAAPERAQLNSVNVEDEISRRISNGALLTAEASKALVDAAVQGAKEQATQEVTAKFSLMQQRRTQLNGLPEPPEDILGAGEEEFAEHLKEAKRRQAELKEKNVPASQHFAALPWAPKSEYDSQLAMLTEVMGQSNAPSAGKSGSKPEPLLSTGEPELMVC